MKRRLMLNGADVIAAATGGLVGLAFALAVVEATLRRRAGR